MNRRESQSSIMKLFFMIFITTNMLMSFCHGLASDNTSREAKSSPNVGSTIHPDQILRSSNKLKLISFDLDDTLFPITETLEDANKVMIERMVNDFGAVSVSSESVREATLQIRRSLQNPITYSELRIRAIESEIKRCCGDFIEGGTRLAAEVVFEAWLAERQRAADRWLFPKAVETLQELRDRYPYAQIVAITNGRGTPFEMPSLASLFDFCISGEDDNVFPMRKPHRGIYEEALSRAGLCLPFDDDTSWVHVGDDLANDVGGSAACGALTIHATIIHEERPKTIFWSTASDSEQAERKRKDEEAQAKVGARIKSLDELPQAVAQLLVSKHTGL